MWKPFATAHGLCSLGSVPILCEWSSQQKLPRVCTGNPAGEQMDDFNASQSEPSDADEYCLRNFFTRMRGSTLWALRKERNIATVSARWQVIRLGGCDILPDFIQISLRRQTCQKEQTLVWTLKTGRNSSKKLKQRTLLDVPSIHPKIKEISTMFIWNGSLLTSREHPTSTLVHCGP